MKIKCLAVDVTALRSHERAERAILGVILVWHFWPIQASFVVVTPLCDVGTSSNKLTQGNLMKIEWLVANITAVGSPDICSGTCYFGDNFGWA